MSRTSGEEKTCAIKDTSPDLADRLRLNEPVIVLTCARAGSTLLRFILDSHPDLACPPETNIAKAISNNVTAWKILTGSGELAADEAAVIRGVVDTLMNAYLSRRGRRRWCDKSLGTAEVAATLLEIYPRAQFICLYRHCMDVIASAIEACPWGVAGYGFEPYVYNNPGNNVAALAHYWADHTTAILDFEDNHQDRCHRVYYEDLATSPEVTAKEMFSFLGASEGAEIPGVRLIKPDDVPGPADYKIWGTNQITDDSVGRGVTIPIGVMPGPLLGVVNALLERLGYAQVDEEWSRTPGNRILVRGVRAGYGSAEDIPRYEHNGYSADLETLLARRIYERLDSGLPLPMAEARNTRPSGVLIVVKLARRSLSASALRVDFDTMQVADGERAAKDSDWVLTADQDIWQAVLTGELNVGVALRQGRIQFTAGLNGDAAHQPEPGYVLADLLGMAPRILGNGKVDRSGS